MTAQPLFVGGFQPRFAIATRGKGIEVPEHDVRGLCVRISAQAVIRDSEAELQVAGGANQPRRFGRGAGPAVEDDGAVHDRHSQSRATHAAEARMRAWDCSLVPSDQVI